jgi:hypothetical protein
MIRMCLMNRTAVWITQVRGTNVQLHVHMVQMFVVFTGQTPTLFFSITLMVLFSCSVYVIDLGSVHGTFVSNERLSKDNPVELEVGQSLRFAASTRSYVLRKNILVPSSATSSQSPANFVYPPAPDPADQEAVVAYNTSLNRLGVPSPTSLTTNLQSKPRYISFLLQDDL